MKPACRHSTKPRQPRLAWCVALFGMMVVSCATPTATFSSKDPMKATLVTWDDISGPGEPLGDAPVTVELSKLAGKAVRLSAAGKIPEYWVVPTPKGPKLEVSVKLLDAPTGVVGADGREKDAAADRNDSFRLLMAAYEALSHADMKVARDLATKLGEVEPKTAAPYIIIALTHIDDGAKDQARVALERAKVLDPKDTRIDELLKAVE